jgi:hypothetical protein
MLTEDRTQLEERLKELDDRLQEKKLILLRGIDSELACKIRYDKREIEKEINEILLKLLINA